MIGKIALGASGVMVSELALGTMYMGSRINDETSDAVLDAYLARGGTFLDTANNYAYWVDGCTGTESEGFLGRWFAKTGKRHDIFLATKVGFDKKGVGKGLKRRQIIENCEASLRLLKTDYIDLYYAHTDDRTTPLEETLEAFAGLHKAGKIRYLGASNYTPWRMEMALSLSADKGYPSFVCLQERFTYLRPVPRTLDRSQIDITDDVMDYSLSRGLTLLAYSPLLQGFYSHPERSVPDQYAGDFNNQRLRALREVASEIGGITLNQLVLAWMRKQKASVIPLISGSTPTQVDENIKCIDIKLSNEQMERLNQA